MIPPGTDLQAAYASANGNDQALILNLALFFSGYLRTHTILLESSVSPKCSHKHINIYSL